MKTSLLAVALVALVLSAPAALAQTDTTNPIATAPVKNPPAATTASTKARATKTPYKGTVKSIDASSLVVTTAKGDITLAIDAKTKVKVDKKAAKVTDITVGETVTGSYTTDAAGSLTAASIHTKTK